MVLCIRICGERIHFSALLYLCTYRTLPPPPSQLDQGVHQRSVQADLQASFGPSKSPESSPRLSHPLGFGRLAFRYSSRGKLSAPMAPWSMPHFSSGGGGEIDCSGFWKLIFACSPYFKYELHLSPMSKHQID
jgi:hypothetical protein